MGLPRDVFLMVVDRCEKSTGLALRATSRELKACVDAHHNWWHDRFCGSGLNSHEVIVNKRQQHHNFVWNKRNHYTKKQKSLKGKIARRKLTIDYARRELRDFEARQKRVNAKKAKLELELADFKRKKKG